MLPIPLLTAGAVMVGYGTKRLLGTVAENLVPFSAASRRKKLIPSLARSRREMVRHPQGEMVERFNPAAALDLIWQPSRRQLRIHESVSWVTLGLATLGTAWPVLQLACVPLLVFRSMPFLGVAYNDLVKERKITLAVLLSALLVGGIAAGYVLAVSVAYWVVAQIYSTLFQVQHDLQRSLLTQFGEIPETAWVLRDGVETETSLADVLVGDVVVVRAGETIPLDGTIVEGQALVDQHRLTGEAQPVERLAGDPVLASTVLLSGSLRIRVDRGGHESTVASIAQAVNNTVEYRSEFMTRSRRIGDRAAPPVLLLSLATLALRGPSGALAILESNFGFNIRMVGPITMLSFLELASRDRILIKDAKALEILNTIDTVVFDKTGTLTEERPTLAQVHPMAGLDPDRLLALAAAAEQRQSHPVAQAIRAAAAERGLPLPSVEEAEYQIGLGLQVTIDGARVQLGSARFMHSVGVAIPDTVRPLKERTDAVGHSLIYLSMDGLLAGVLELRPTYRREAAALIAELRRRGLTTYLISGDHEAPTRQLAQDLGIDAYHADTLPEGKAQRVKELQEAGRHVCFIGDGINDGVALMQANVSVSLRGATSVATDAAHIVLLDGSLGQLVPLLDLAKAYERHIDTGIKMSMVPGVLCIGGVYLFNLGFLGAVAIFSAGIVAGAVHALLPRLLPPPTMSLLKEREP